MLLIIKRNFLFQVIIVFVLGLLIEFFWFNLDYFLLRQKDIPKNIEFNMQNAELYNWQKTDTGYVSQPDPMIILNGINCFVDNIRIDITPDLDISNGTIFFTNDNIEVFGIEEGIININSSLKNNKDFKIDEFIRDLRVDIGESEGTQVVDVNITINYNKLDFRFTRVIIIVLIYVVGYFLLTLQRPRKYDI